MDMALIILMRTGHLGGAVAPIMIRTHMLRQLTQPATDTGPVMLMLNQTTRMRIMSPATHTRINLHISGATPIRLPSVRPATAGHIFPDTPRTGVTGRAMLTPHHTGLGTSIQPAIGPAYVRQT
jgi:hypothetical protein